MKKILIGLLLLFAVSACGADYATDSAAVTKQIKQNVGWATDTDSTMDVVIFSYIQEGALLVSSATASRTLFDTVETTVYKHFIAYDTLLYVITDVAFFSKDSIKELKWRDREGWDTLEAVDDYLINKTKWEERLPSYYDWNGGYLFLFPTPGHTGDDILIMGYGRPDNMEGAVTLTDINLEHRPAVVYYATAMFAMRLGLPTTQMWEEKFRYYMNTINVTVNRKEYDGKQN